MSVNIRVKGPDLEEADGFSLYRCPPPPLPNNPLHTSRARSRLGIIGHRPLVLDSPVTSHRALPAISQRPLPPPQPADK